MNTTREGWGGGREERTDGRNSSIYGIFEGIPVPNYTDIVQCYDVSTRRHVLSTVHDTKSKNRLANPNLPNDRG